MCLESSSVFHATVISVPTVFIVPLCTGIHFTVKCALTYTDFHIS